MPTLDKLNEYVDSYNQLYAKKYRDRYSNKPRDIQVMTKRTLATAISILAHLKEVPYEELITSIYIYCKDSNLMWLTQEYEKQIELAGANPERFIFQLHSFYNAISAKIRKHNRYAEIIDYQSAYMELAYTDSPEINKNVTKAYKELLVHTPEYLRSRKYDFTQCIIGVTSDGRPINVPQIFPLYDMPVYEMEESVYSGKLTAEQAGIEFPKFFAKYRIPIRTWDELAIYDQLYMMQASTIAALMPYVNEYTSDIVPQTYYESHKLFCDALSAPIPANNLLVFLKARKRALPVNGARIVFDDPSSKISELLLKETVKSNAVIMLYRLTTRDGDFSGYFNTRSGFFFSICLEAKGDSFYEGIRHFILYCYAACVTNQIPSENYVIHNDGSPVPFKIFWVGGKLKASYNPVNSDAKTPQSDNPSLEKKTVPISENIRKLPIGQKASENAVLLARQWGYDLDPGETFVRPFSKDVFVRQQN